MFGTEGIDLIGQQFQRAPCQFDESIEDYWSRLGLCALGGGVDGRGYEHQRVGMSFVVELSSYFCQFLVCAMTSFCITHDIIDTCVLVVEIDD